MRITTNVALLIIAGILFGAGAWLARRNRWRRRVGDVPHCVKCEYVLIGNDTGICPECGSRLTADTIVYGDRKRRPPSVFVGFISGAVAILIAAHTIVPMARAVNWYHYRPAAWVINDLDSGKMRQAWDELQDRIAKNELSSSGQYQLIERGLREQESAGNLPELVDYLGDRYSAHRLTEGQIKRFFDAQMKVSLEVRPIAGATDPIAYRLTGHGCGPSQRWWLHEAEEGHWVDDIKVNHDDPGGSGGFGWTRLGTIPPQSVGKHRLRVDVNLKTGKGSIPTDASPVGEQSRKLQLTADFEILSAPSVVTCVTKPNADMFQPPWSASHFFIDREHRRFTGDIYFPQMPADFAMKMFVRVNGKEYQTGAFNYRKKWNSPDLGWHHIVMDELPPCDLPEFDLILRSREEFALETLDMTHIWKGEVVFPKMRPVQFPKVSR